MNKIKKSILRLLFCFFTVILFNSFSALHAQDLVVQSIDSLSWPKIKVSLAYKGKNKFTKELIKLSVNNDLIDFTLRDGSIDNQKLSNKSIYILIEASGNTFGKSIADIRSGVRSFIDKLDDNDVMNIGYFSSIEVDSLGLQNISDKFNNRREGLKFDLDNKVKQVKDSLMRIDLYRSIRDGLELFHEEKNIPTHKVFIVISTGKNNSSSPVGLNDCVKRSKEYKIPIHSIFYNGLDSIVNTSSLRKISSQTNGLFNRADEDKDITKFIIDYVNEPPPDKVYEGAYDLLIDVSNFTKDNKIKIDLHYNGTRQIISASNPEGIFNLSKDYQLYLLVSVGILIFIVLIMILAKVFSHKSSTIAESTDDIEEKSKTNKATIEPELPKYTKTTIIESPSLIHESNEKLAVHAVLLVNSDGRTNSFVLSKKINTIGRHTTNDIVIGEQTITGKHAIIEIIDKQIILKDLGSTNGTFVNQEKIKSKTIVNGDHIKMGNIEMTLKIS